MKELKSRIFVTKNILKVKEILDEHVISVFSLIYKIFDSLDFPAVQCLAFGIIILSPNYKCGNQTYKRITIFHQIVYHFNEVFRLLLKILAFSSKIMSPLKIFCKWCFLFGIIFGRVHDQQFDDIGLFEFRSTNAAVTDDFFADSTVMYDTLYETVLDTDSGITDDLISNEMKIQKIKTYSRFLKQLGSFKIANADDLSKMTKLSARKRRTFRKIQLNTDSLKSETSGHWTLLSNFFHQN